MKYRIYILIILSLFFIKCSTCDDIKKHVQGLNCKFKVHEKYRGQYIKIKGFDTLNKVVEFEEGEFWGIFDSIEINDTLLKELGKTELVLIKKDTTLVFPLKCRGKVVK